jgi:hypothetical protein
MVATHPEGLKLRIASPCSVAWDSMVGDAQVRFCGSCQKHVYNLSAMTLDEARALIAEREGRLCARVYQRADGTVLTADCPVGRSILREAEQRLNRKLRAGAMAAVALVSMLPSMGSLSGLRMALGRAINSFANTVEPMDPPPEFKHRNITDLGAVQAVDP